MSDKYLTIVAPCSSYEYVAGMADFNFENIFKNVSCNQKQVKQHSRQDL